MEYTKPTLMLVGAVGAVVLSKGVSGGEDSPATSPGFAILGLDD